MGILVTFIERRVNRHGAAVRCHNKVSECFNIYASPSVALRQHITDCVIVRHYHAPRLSPIIRLLDRENYLGTRREPVNLRDGFHAPLAAAGWQAPSNEAGTLLEL